MELLKELKREKIKILADDKKFYADGLSKHNVLEIQYEESLHR